MEKPTSIKIALTEEMEKEIEKKQEELYESFMANEKTKKIYDEIEKVCKAENREVFILTRLIDVFFTEQEGKKYLEIDISLYMTITTPKNEKDETWDAGIYKIDSTSPYYSPYGEPPILSDTFSDELKQAINKLYVID